MNKIVVYLLIITTTFSIWGCKAKKCTNFNDPQQVYKANYDKNGLIKKKQKAPTKNWSNN